MMQLLADVTMILLDSNSSRASS